MKTKYTLQELRAKGIIIDCPSRKIANKVCNLLNIKPLVEWEEDETCLWVYWSNGFTPDFFKKEWAESQEDKKIIPASEFFMETPEEKADEVIEKLDEKQLKLTPIEIHNIDLWLADIHCFVAGIIATQAEFESKFDILISADRKLKDLREKIKELL